MKDSSNEESTEQHAQQSLDELRTKIDVADQKLIALINQRAKYVVEVGNLKRANGIPIYAPHREAAVLEKVQRLNEGPISDRTIEAVYRELMSGSFALEQPLRIGYLGPVGTFSHYAAMRHFGSSVELIISAPSKASFKKSPVVTLTMDSFQSKTAPAAASPKRSMHS